MGKRAINHPLLNTTGELNRRWRALLWIALAQVGAMSTWFSAAAVAPSLVRDWHVTPAAGSCPAFRAWRLSRGGLATGMKMGTGWFRTDRGRAMGILVGALTLGSALPHLMIAVGPGCLLPWQSVIGMTSIGAIVSGLIVALVGRSGPFEEPGALLDVGWAIRSLRDPALRLANFGYFGHMWELYAMWTWAPGFLLASFQKAHVGGSPDAIVQSASYAATLVIGAGALGSLGAGLLADRLGRTTVTAGAMVVSGTTAIVSGFLFGQNPILVVAVATIWGIAVIADSSQFSAAVSELAETNRVGSALALQTALGFLLTSVSIQLLPLVESLGGWELAFSVLAMGPVFGTLAMLRLRWRPEAKKLANGHR